MPAPAIDVGQTESLVISTTWSGGSAPYTATLYSGATAGTCTTKVSSETETGTSAAFTVTSPDVAQTYFCIGVTDSSIPVSSGISTPALFAEVAPPLVSLPAGYEIAAGSGTAITATAVNTGVLPDMFTWYIGSGCPSGAVISGPNASPTYNTGVITTTTTYSVLLTDSSTGTPAMSSCASITITVNNGPISVAAVSTGIYAGLVYVANPTSPGSGSLADSLSVIDTDSNSVTTTIPLTYGAYTVNPWGVAVDTVNSLVYVTGQYGAGFNTMTPTIVGGVVCSVSMATNTEVGCSTTGSDPEGVAVNNALGTAFVANNGDDTVSVFSTPSLTLLNTLGVGPGPENVAVDQSTYTVYVTDNGGNTLSVIQPRLGGGFAVTTVNVGFEPVGVAVDPMTNDVWVTNSGAGTVSVLSGLTYNTLQTIKVGGSPTGIAISDANNEALVANAATNTVTPISLTTFAPGTPVAVGSDPFGVAAFLSSISGIPSLAYVANSGSNFVSVIDLATGQVIATIVVP